jgi:hypothetical protein
MKSDWLLILSVLCLGFGLGVILGYCTDHSSFAAAYPFARSVLHVDFTTVGPGVLGGLALLLLGCVLLVWAFFAAILGQIRSIGEEDSRATGRLLD